MKEKVRFPDAEETIVSTISRRKTAANVATAETIWLSVMELIQRPTAIKTVMPKGAAQKEKAYV